jgi:HAD superfamily hydrolase (TIGR01484 family)
MSNYRALVFDIDGTAVRNAPEAQPSQRLLKAIAAAQSRLELFAATGRPKPFAAPILKTLGLTNPCIAAGGTLVIDPTTGETINQSTLTLDAMRTIHAAMKPFPYTVHLPINKQSRPLMTPRVTSRQPYLSIPGVTSADITGILQALAHVQGVTAAVSQDWSGGLLVQVTNANATKKHRIREVLEKLGVRPEQTIGVGDGDNDIHLFAAVGYRIAMGNATEQLKSLAEEIAPTIDEDGLAQIIEKYAQQ